MAETLELLAPARDAATALAAISHGADAVYIGAPAFGARAAATNSLEDIARVVEAAHPFGVKVYVTLNTIIFDDELEEVSRLVRDLWKIGVDALIVQDMALLGLDIPPIDLHASTQTDARTTRKICNLARAGFSQIVVPREFSLDQIKEASEALAGMHLAEAVKLEVFVHGALCVSFSGDCHAGAVLSRRSANRGECPQVCRLLFTLTDGSGRPVTPPDGGSPTRHWLSTADLNRLDYLKELIEAGAGSFKIEGRLKSIDYVKNVTLAYSKELDTIVEASGGRLRRSSYGRVKANFAPDLSRSFNRGFTPYFLKPGFSTKITSWKTPKWVGRPVAKLIGAQGARLKVSLIEPVNNGDGLGFFDSEGRFTGFRVNRAEGSFLYPAPGSNLPAEKGTLLYRNADSAWDTALARNDSAARTIAVEMLVRPTPDGRVALDAGDERGCRITVCSTQVYSDKARTPQEGQRRGILERLGDTVYRLESLDDRCGDMFIPSKELTALRRLAVKALDDNWKIRFRRPTRRPDTLSPDALDGYVATYHDNIANREAEKFYESHGAAVGEKAVEVEIPKGKKRVMTTRYCLRHELGCCLKKPGADRLPAELFLDAPIGRLELRFDCKNCNMQAYKN